MEVSMKSIITAELEIVALGTGETGMSKHISEAVKAIESSGIKYELTPMGTVLEADSIDEVFRAVKAAHEALVKKGIKRVVTHITIDDRRDRPKGMAEKIEAVRSKL
jgi:uncharacterized protein (TIGR00106 family)